MGNQVEGSLLPGQKVVIVEDLISTGNSSLNALAALRAAQTEVLGMVAIFSYKFKLAEENFRINNCELTTLSNYPALLDLAVKSGQISAEQLETLNEWRKDPGNWTP
jgi:orotate phosphoribosyltransferase